MSALDLVIRTCLSGLKSRPALSFGWSRCFMSTPSRPPRLLNTSSIARSLSTTELFKTSLLRYPDHIHLRIYNQTKALFPFKQHVFLFDNWNFDLREFLKRQGHPASVYDGDSGSFKTLIREHDEEGFGFIFRERVLAGAWDFEHKGTQFHVLYASYKDGDDAYCGHHIFFDGTDDSAGRELVKDVFDGEAALKDEIWVFSDGNWEKDKKMYKTIKMATWNDLVLDEELMRRIKTDTATFFASHDVYKSLDVTWKRGLLLIGPPGNGKTQTMQALLRDAMETGIGCIYVKSFSTDRGTESGIRSIFQKAREQSPCILILEDLDAMVHDSVRSFFLNELDGLENNDGILTLATTNHPERIDDAILRRPSRFDKKYTFALPSFSLRKRYALKWIAKLKSLDTVDIGGKDDVALAHAIATDTDDWSYAYLKELFVSYLLRSASDRALEGQLGVKQFTMLDGLLQEVKLLGQQVTRGGKPGF